MIHLNSIVSSLPARPQRVTSAFSKIDSFPINKIFKLGLIFSGISYGCYSLVKAYQFKKHHIVLMNDRFKLSHCEYLLKKNDLSLKEKLKQINDLLPTINYEEINEDIDKFLIKLVNYFIEKNKLEQAGQIAEQIDNFKDLLDCAKRIKVRSHNEFEYCNLFDQAYSLYETHINSMDDETKKTQMTSIINQYLEFAKDFYLINVKGLQLKAFAKVTKLSGEQLDSFDDFKRIVNEMSYYFLINEKTEYVLLINELKNWILGRPREEQIKARVLLALHFLSHENVELAKIELDDIGKALENPLIDLTQVKDKDFMDNFINLIKFIRDKSGIHQGELEKNFTSQLIKISNIGSNLTEVESIDVYLQLAKTFKELNTEFYHYNMAQLAFEKIKELNSDNTLIIKVDYLLQVIPCLFNIEDKDINACFELLAQTFDLIISKKVLPSNELKVLGNKILKFCKEQKNQAWSMLFLDKYLPYLLNLHNSPLLKIKEITALLREDELLFYDQKKQILNVAKDLLDQVDPNSYESALSYVVQSSVELNDLGNSFEHFMINYIRQQCFGQIFYAGVTVIATGILTMLNMNFKVAAVTSTSIALAYKFKRSSLPAKLRLSPYL